MKTVYLDNSATTPLCAEAERAITGAFSLFANPSSLHSAGIEAASLLDSSRGSLIASSGLGHGYTAVFCGSGSEANNLAIAGVCRCDRHFASKRIIISDSEHPSVYATALSLAERGFETVPVPTRGGALDLDALERELKKGAALVSIMSVNNETGAEYDIASALALCRKICPDALFHTDAVQGFMRIPLCGGCDAISVSAHKIGGPKGCGALFVSEKTLRRRAVSPVIFGGGQEFGLRSGTENTPYIAGFAAAARRWSENRGEFSARLDRLYSLTADAAEAAGCRVNRPASAVSHIVSVTLPGIKSQVMLSFLSSKGIFVSSGSACSSKDKKLSRALTAFGLCDRDADCTVRVSISPDNTPEDIAAFGSALAEGCGRLVRIR